MKEFQITEEQIKTIYEATSVNNQEQLREWFKEVFETKLEVGKWYKDNIGEGLYFITEIQEPYFYYHGFNYFFNYNEKDYYAIERCDLVLATEEEVFKALKKESKKRGFVKGVSFISVGDGNITALDEDIEYDIKYNCLFVGGRDITGVIFENGKWAEIISKPGEIIELNGIKYKRID